MLSLSGMRARVLLQLLIPLVTWSVVTVTGNYDDICMYVVNKQFELLEFRLEQKKSPNVVNHTASQHKRTQKQTQSCVLLNRQIWYKK